MQVLECRRLPDVKRDMDFVREILLRIEGDPSFDGSHGSFVFEPSDFPGHTKEELAYHIKLLLEASFIKCPETMTFDMPALAISRLTWDGHEFIGDTSDPDVWEKVKERTKGLPDIAISAVWEIAKAEVRKKLGLL